MSENAVKQPESAYLRPIQAKNYSQVSINCLPGKAIEDVEKEKN